MDDLQACRRGSSHQTKARAMGQSCKSAACLSDRRTILGRVDWKSRINEIWPRKSSSLWFNHLACGTRGKEWVNLFCLLSISRNDNFVTNYYHLLRVRYSRWISSLDAPPPPCSILTGVNRLLRWTKTIINELGGWLGIGDGGNLIAYFYEIKRCLKK
jgi:hypothetical protein